MSLSSKKSSNSVSKSFVYKQRVNNEKYAKVYHFNSKSRNVQMLMNQIQEAQDTDTAVYHVFDIPGCSKIRANERQLLNINYISMWTINYKPNAYHMALLKQPLFRMSLVHEAVWPELFLAAKVCFIVKNKKQPIVLNDVFFDDATVLLQTLGMPKLTTKEVWHCRTLTFEEKQNCIYKRTPTNSCDFLKFAKTHTYIIFDISLQFASDFIPLSQFHHQFNTDSESETYV